jgi:hypothetical protein
MKSKDQQLLEEAYLKTRLVKEESVDDFHNRMMKDEAQTSVVTPEIEEEYNKAYEAYKNGDMSPEEWAEKCAELLVAMKIIKDVPERDISEEEDEQMIAADLANKE